MIKIIGSEKSDYPVERLTEIRNKFGFFLKPFIERENEDKRKKYLGVLDETKKVLKQLNERMAKLKNLNYEYKKMQLSEKIVKDLIFIAEKRFLSPQLRADIKTIIKKLKLMSLKDLEKQNEIVETVKSKILENVRR